MTAPTMPAFFPDSTVVERVEPSPNFDDRMGLGRPDMIVLHYTGMQSCQEAIDRLRDPEARVSSHYVVQEDGAIVQMVPEAKRAWHAGISSWEGEPDINSRSIGIEICNPGHDFGYPDFPQRQLAATVMLCRSILKRHDIRPHNVVAHSDVAPSRKQDPGEKFPWAMFARSGIGLWVEPEKGTAEALRLGDSGERVDALQRTLAAYGYGVEQTGYYDTMTAETVTAFQRHFRPAQVDGIADGGTLATLDKLLAARPAPRQRQAPEPMQAQLQQQPIPSSPPEAALPWQVPELETPVTPFEEPPSPAVIAAAPVEPARDTRPRFLRALWRSS